MSRSGGCILDQTRAIATRLARRRFMRPPRGLCRILTRIAAMGLVFASPTFAQYDVLIRNGMIYDGSGSRPATGEIAISGDTLAAVGRLRDAHGKVEIDAKGLAVAPGFINMLSHSEETLIADGRSQGDLRQGVTLEVFGEMSMGPLTDTLKRESLQLQTDIKYPISWTTLGQYLAMLEHRGIATNVASFVGAGTVRSNVLHYDRRHPTAQEREQMKGLVRSAMQEGALGLTTALLYVPDVYMSTDELIELAREAAAYGGIFTAHIRNEGTRLPQAVQEMVQLSRAARIPVEIYHFKAAGADAWPLIDSAIAMINGARRAGVPITADVYTFPAAATGLDACMPPWVQEGGFAAWAERLKDPAVRERLKKEIVTPSDDWEHEYLEAGSPDRVLLVSFRNPRLKPLTGKTLAEVARMRGTSPVETMMDLVIEDSSRVGTIYFTQSEDNLRKEIRQPWVSFGSDEGSCAPEGVFLLSNPHPRAYGTFAQLLGKYVREEGVISLSEAVRRLTSLPAANLRLVRRGSLKPGYFADLVIFDPATVANHATYAAPHRYATGVKDVFVNGVQVIKDGEHTGALPGRIVYGPGKSKAVGR